MANAILSRAVFPLCCSVCVLPSALPNKPSERKDITPDLSVHHYVRAKDPKWCAKQLVPLRQELVEIDQQIRTFRLARKDGRGTTGAVDLENEPEGVTADAQVFLLQQRRTLVLQRIGEIEDEARQNEVTPGTVRSVEDAIKESGVSANANNETGVNMPEIAETGSGLCFSPAIPQIPLNLFSGRIAQLLSFFSHP